MKSRQRRLRSRRFVRLVPDAVPGPRSAGARPVVTEGHHAKGGHNYRDRHQPPECIPARAAAVSSRTVRSRQELLPCPAVLHGDLVRCRAATLCRGPRGSLVPQAARPPCARGAARRPCARSAARRPCSRSAARRRLTRLVRANAGHGRRYSSRECATPGTELSSSLRPGIPNTAPITAGRATPLAAHWREGELP
jgi:hypothetical protein